MQQRDRRSEIKANHDYEIPSAHHCELDALPAFLNQGWVEAFRQPSKCQPPELSVYEADLDNGAWIQFAKTAGQNSPLQALPEFNVHHVQERDEEGRGGIGETYIAGDFYIDWRKNRKWTGRKWKTIDVEIRVRRRPDSPEQTTLIVNGEKVNGITVNSDGSVDIDEEYVNDTIEVIVVETVEE